MDKKAVELSGFIEGLKETQKGMQSLKKELFSFSEAIDIIKKQLDALKRLKSNFSTANWESSFLKSGAKDLLKFNCELYQAQKILKVLEERFLSSDKNLKSLCLKTRDLCAHIQDLQDEKLSKPLLEHLKELLRVLLFLKDALMAMKQEIKSLWQEIEDFSQPLECITHAFMSLQETYVKLKNGASEYTQALKALKDATSSQCIAQGALNALLAVNPFPLAYLDSLKLKEALLKIVENANNTCKVWVQKAEEIKKAHQCYEDFAFTLSHLSQAFESLGQKSSLALNESLMELQKLLPSLTSSINAHAKAQALLNAQLKNYVDLQAKRTLLDLSHSPLNSSLGGRELLEKLKQEEKAIYLSLEEFNHKIKDLSLSSKEQIWQVLVNSSFKSFDYEKVAQEAKEKNIRLTKEELVRLSAEMKKLGEKAEGYGKGFLSDCKLNLAHYLLGTRGQEAQKFKESIHQAFSQAQESLASEQTHLTRFLETLPPLEWEKIIKTPSSPPASPPVFKEFNSALDEELKDLRKRLRETEDTIKELGKIPEEVEFHSVHVGQDPWGLQSLMDLTGHLAVASQKQRELLGQSFKSDKDLVGAYLAKEGLEKAIAQKEALLQQAGESPALKNLAKASEESAKEAEKANQVIAETTTKTVNSTIASLGESADRLSKESQDAIKKKLEDIKKEIAKGSRQLAQLVTQLSQSLANSSLSIYKDFASQADQNYLAKLEKAEKALEERRKEAQERRQAEEERQAEEKRQREHEQAMQSLEQEIEDLTARWEASSSVKERAELAEQIEQAKKKKAAESQRREEELQKKEELKREKQELYDFDCQKYQLDCQRIERENQMAQSTKAQKISQVWIDAASGIASAWANSCSLPLLWFGGVFTTMMLSVAAAQTALIAKENVTKDKPPSPKAPRFRHGGLVGDQGPQGMNAIVGDGVAEAILPLEKNTWEMLAQALAPQLAQVLSTLELQSAEREAASVYIQNLQMQTLVNQTNYNHYHLKTSLEPSQESLEKLDKSIKTKYDKKEDALIYYGKWSNKWDYYAWNRNPFTVEIYEYGDKAEPPYTNSVWLSIEIGYSGNAYIGMEKALFRYRDDRFHDSIETKECIRWVNPNSRTHPYIDAWGKNFRADLADEWAERILDMGNYLERGGRFEPCIILLGKGPYKDSYYFTKKDLTTLKAFGEAWFKYFSEDSHKSLKKKTDEVKKD
ncbi:UNVERIFIED_CONTAM: hypothetical protein PYX00_010830 [Menopon gallinae]|uniref:Uncharacterized protein n=1 Tax=Menopon gallinae TaxID=328185 RepID=A0AAW2H6C8_9NEOP